VNLKTGVVTDTQDIPANSSLAQASSIVAKKSSAKNAGSKAASKSVNSKATKKAPAAKAANKASAKKKSAPKGR
jgi:hypothetical protein